MDLHHLYTNPKGSFEPGKDFTICLAHGAGAPMDSPFMSVLAEGLAARGLRVARFEFPYMAARLRQVVDCRQASRFGRPQ